MQSVKSITLKKISCLTYKQLAAIALLLGSQLMGLAQDNSPYSRYGLGDLTPNTHVLNRSLGGISAGYSDFSSINFTNPASYSSFQTIMEQRFKKPVYSRVILDIGVNYDNRTLREPNTTAKFAANNAQFSYIQLGMPLKKNWGLTFGLRPVSSINYKVVRRERLAGIDSVITEFTGEGGAYLPTIGTGFAIKNFSIGFNGGYLFGRKSIVAKRGFLNDTVEYNRSNHTTNTSFGGLFFNAGLQYKIELGDNRDLTLGAFGNIKRNITASQDVVRETFVRDPNSFDDFTLDSVYTQKDIAGKITYPSSYGIGFVYRQDPNNAKKRTGSWLIGVDFLQSQWSQFRFYNQADAVQNNWELRTGVQIIPTIPGATIAGVAPKRSGYWSYVAYRAGMFVGKDYINTGKELPLLGFTFGMGLPLLNYNAAARGQATTINLALEYSKRGNNDNLLKENLFRVSLGLSLSDLWFAKRKYD
jgi:hypothetical protein